MEKPTRVLCKRSLIIGDPFWWDDTVFPAVKHERDNRMLVKGDWYDVVYNEHDVWTEKDKTFSIIDNQGNRHLHYMYSEQDYKNGVHLVCKKGFNDQYSPRDYAKWFYTPEELAVREEREQKKILVV